MFPSITLFLDTIDVAAFSWREVILFGSVLCTLLCVIVFYITHHFAKQQWYGRRYFRDELLTLLKENHIHSLHIVSFAQVTPVESVKTYDFHGVYVTILMPEETYERIFLLTLTPTDIPYAKLCEANYIKFYWDDEAYSFDFCKQDGSVVWQQQSRYRYLMAR